ncbi:hypothetical protein ACIGHG_00710 [Bacillus sp. NPDC077411]
MNNQNKKKNTVQTGGMYGVFLYEKRGVTMLLSVWLIYQLLAS